MIVVDRRNSKHKRFVALVLMSLMLCCGASCGQTKVETHSDNTVSVTKSSHETERQIVAFCSACHAMPKPGSFPKSAWYDEVKKGFGFYHQSGRKDLTPPPLQTVVEYFRTLAPERLSIPQAESVHSVNGLHFHPTEMVISTTTDREKPPAVSFIGRLDRGMPCRGRGACFCRWHRGGFACLQPDSS